MLKDLVTDINSSNQRLILRTNNTGAWLNVRGTIVTGTVLEATKSRDFYAHVTMLPPPNIQSKCNSCGTSFDVPHKLGFSKGGLVIAH